MKKFPWFVLLIVLSLNLNFINVNAFEYDFGQEINIDKPVTDDLYLMSDKVDINANITNDLAVIAGEVNLNNQVNGDLFALTGKANIKGPINDDLRIIAGEISVEQNIASDCLLIGGKINIKTTEIGGDVLIMGGDVSIDANIKGKAKIYASKVIINGNIAGETLIEASEIIINGTFSDKTKLVANKINFGAKTVFQSDLEYYQSSGTNSALNNQVQGKLIFNDQLSSKKEKESAKNFNFPFTSFLKGAILILLFMFITKNFFIISAQKVHDNMLNHFLQGFAFFMLTPLIMIFLLVTIIGIPIAFLLLFAYILVCYFASAITAITFAYLIKIYYDKKQWDNYAIYGLSLVFYTLMVVLPQAMNLGILNFVLFMANFVAICATIGAIMKRKMEIWQEIR